MAESMRCSKTAVIKAMHRNAKMMVVSAFCSTSRGSRVCKTTCRESDGVLISNSRWYCSRCYKRWSRIDHRKVTYYTRAGVEGSEERCEEHLSRLEKQRAFDLKVRLLAEEKEAFYNKKLGKSFAKQTPWERASPNERAAAQRRHKENRAIIAQRRGDGRRFTHEEIEANAKKLSGIVDLEHCPAGWDLIKYGEHQAFLRFDGVIIRRSQLTRWVIETDCPLTNESYSFDNWPEAIMAADQHIPMGELL
jgi:hypothetical protein